MRSHAISDVLARHHASRQRLERRRRPVLDVHVRVLGELAEYRLDLIVDHAGVHPSLAIPSAHRDLAERLGAHQAQVGHTVADHRERRRQEDVGQRLSTQEAAELRCSVQEDGLELVILLLGERLERGQHVRFDPVGAIHVADVLAYKDPVVAYEGAVVLRTRLERGLDEDLVEVVDGHLARECGQQLECGMADAPVLVVDQRMNDVERCGVEGRRGYGTSSAGYDRACARKSKSTLLQRLGLLGGWW